MDSESDLERRYSDLVMIIRALILPLAQSNQFDHCCWYMPYNVIFYRQESQKAVNISFNMMSMPMHTLPCETSMLMAAISL